MASDLYTRSITEYCERVGSYFYSEPINALSNIGFFISALLIYRLFKNKKVKHKGYWLLFVLIVVIGVGSSFWHTVRSPITLALDAVPIWIFFLVFIFLLVQKLTGSKIKTFLFLLGFFLLQLTISYFFPEVLNGSIRHVTNGLTFVLISIWFYKKYSYLSRNLIIAFILYILAIVFAALMPPTDIISLILLTIPLVILYEIVLFFTKNYQ